METLKYNCARIFGGLTETNIEKGKTKGKGFANASILNPLRDSAIFTDAEKQAKAIFDAFELSYVHELRIQLKDSRNSRHCYKLDFFFPNCRIDVEISPDFHETYKLVAIRDVLRERLLRKAGIRTFTIKTKAKKQNGKIGMAIDRKYAQFVAQTVKEAQISSGCLNYWI